MKKTQYKLSTHTYILIKVFFSISEFHCAIPGSKKPQQYSAILSLSCAHCLGTYRMRTVRMYVSNNNSSTSVYWAVCVVCNFLAPGSRIVLLDGNVTELPKNRGCVCGRAISRTMLAHECLHVYSLSSKLTEIIMCPF